MQTRHRISLNAIRVFAIVARTGRLTDAGTELNVTASAVSHQLKKLEDELGVSLFRRGNNTVTLTDAGQRFYQEVAPAIGLIERSAEALYRDDDEITVQASTSLAVRWLIPSLHRFRARCPEARIRVETGFVKDVLAAPVSDISIRYFRAGDASADGWTLLARDLSRPVVSPNILARHGDGQPVDISNFPALQRTAGNWDWQLWCETSGISPANLVFSHEFDTDDAALHACVAGLGTVLAPPILTQREIQAGTLVSLPGYAAVEIGTYRYRSRHDSRMVRRFCDWMADELQLTASP